MKRVFACLIMIILTWSFANVVLAVPQITSVNGSIVHSQQMTISGSGFGSKAQAAPIKWDNFENGSPNQLLKEVEPEWQGYGSHEGALFSDKLSHSDSLSVYNYTPGRSEFDTNYFTFSPASEEVYITYWWRTNNADISPDGDYGVIKLSRITSSAASGGGGVYNGAGVTALSNMCPRYHSSPYLSYDPDGSTTVNLGYLFVPYNQWIRIEMYKKVSTPGVSNGIVIARSVGRGEIVRKNEMTRGAGQSFLQDTVLLGLMMANAQGSYELYLDDIYIDNTRARVEIGDASSFASCTYREIQIPTAWTDTSITITVNQGSFQDGDTAYLFVIDADGNVSNGYPITISGEGGEPQDNPPSVSITSPTSGSRYSTSSASVTISGNASDDNGISSITWSNNRGGNGTVTNSSGDWSNWSINGIALQEGENVITITATDTNNQTSANVITITYTPNNMVRAWSANEQSNDSDWKDSNVTYCVRLLVEGAQVTRFGNRIMLGFKGRTSGDYTIRKVSIAERDPNGGEGDVIDSTWTKVTFDGKDESAWDTDIVTVPAGGEKLSNPIDFPIQAGKDYYVTFKIESPSVYLNPPAYYTELYFYSDDHTEDVDWSGNGHATTQDYHAFSSIYVLNSSDSTTPPTAPRNLSVK